MRNSLSSGGGAADVAVVGGGVIGLAVARAARRRGLTVTLLDGGGTDASRAAAGMLAPQAEADREDDFFRFQSASRDLYPSFAEALQEEAHRDIELDRTGALYLALTEEDEQELVRRGEWQARLGLAVEQLTAAEARELEPNLSPHVRMALRFPRDWQVENRRLVEALRLSCEKAHGVQMLAATPARGVRVGAGGRVEGVETSRGLVAAGAVVVAAGARSSQLRFVVKAGDGESRATVPEHPRVEPVRGQMLCFAQEPNAPLCAHVVYTPRGYVVPRRDGRLLAGSTTERAGFNAVVTAGGVEMILSSAIEIAPAIRELQLADAWAGLRPRAADGLPVIGESADVCGLFYATGHYRNGILLAPLTGEIVASLVSGAESLTRLPFNLEAFSPARFRPALAAANEE